MATTTETKKPETKKPETKKPEAKPAQATTTEIANAPPAAPVEIIKPRDPAEVARVWAEQEGKIREIASNIGSNVLEMGHVLCAAQKDGSWAHVKDVAGQFRFPKFHDVIEALTPWKRAYGYQAMALSRHFNGDQVRALGVKKSLRLAAALEVAKGTEAQKSIEDLCAVAIGLTADQTEEQIATALGRNPTGTTSPAETTAPSATELRGKEFACKMDGNGQTMTGFMAPDDHTTIRVEVRKEAGGVYCKVAILNTAPAAGEGK